MSASQLAKELGIPANQVTEILRGRRGISGDTALRLARWMGTTPQFWMILQRTYELRRVEQEHGDQIRQEDEPPGEHEGA